MTTWAGAGAVVTEQHVGHDGPLWGEFGDHERFERIEAGELLVDPGRGVVSVDERIGELEPVVAFAPLDSFGPSCGCGCGCAAEVPSGHDVGVGVVVDVLVVFVRAHHAADVRAAVGVALDSSRPPARRLHERLRE